MSACPNWNDVAVDSMKNLQGEEIVRAAYENIHEGNNFIFIRNTKGNIVKSKLFTDIAKTIRAKDRNDYYEALNMYLDTYTPQFKNWFKDSKFVDNNGEPLLLFHGSSARFSTFDPGIEKFKVHDTGMFFTGDPKIAKLYGKHVYPVYLNASSIEEVDSSRGMYREAKQKENDILNNTNAEGVIIRKTNDRGGRQTQYVVFKPNQVKSLLNSGSFLKANHDGVKVGQGLKRGNNFVVHKIFQDGNEIGEVVISINDGFADIWNTRVNGRTNAGTYSYLQLGRMYANNGLILRSDTTKRRSLPANKLWERLSRFDYATKQGDFYLYEEPVSTPIEDDTLFSKDGLKGRGIDVSKEAHVLAMDAALDFMEAFGIDYSLETNVDGTYNFLAAARIKKGLITFKKELFENPDTRQVVLNQLPQEISHFFYRLLKEDDELRQALWDAVKKDHPLIKELIKRGYKGNISKLREEAIGQLIEKAMFNEASARTRNFWQKFIEFVKGIFRKLGILGEAVQTPFEVAAIKILNSDYTGLMTIDEYNELANSIGDFVNTPDAESTVSEVFTKDNELDKLYNKALIKFSLDKYKEKLSEQASDIAGRNIKRINNNITSPFKLVRYIEEPVTITLKSFDELIKKYKSKIPLKQEIKLNGISNIELNYINDVRKIISETYPNLKSIDVSEFIIEIKESLREVSIGFSKQNMWSDYNTGVFNQRKKVFHNKYTMSINNTYLKSKKGSHFGETIFGSITPLFNTEDMISGVDANGKPFNRLQYFEEDPTFSHDDNVTFPGESSIRVTYNDGTTKDFYEGMSGYDMLLDIYNNAQPIGNIIHEIQHDAFEEIDDLVLIYGTSKESYEEFKDRVLRATEKESSFGTIMRNIILYDLDHNAYKKIPRLTRDIIENDLYSKDALNSFIENQIRHTTEAYKSVLRNVDINIDNFYRIIDMNSKLNKVKNAVFDYNKKQFKELIDSIYRILEMKNTVIDDNAVYNELLYTDYNDYIGDLKQIYIIDPIIKKLKEYYPSIDPLYVKKFTDYLSINLTHSLNSIIAQSFNKNVSVNKILPRIIFGMTTRKGNDILRAKNQVTDAVKIKNSHENILNYYYKALNLTPEQKNQIVDNYYNFRNTAQKYFNEIRKEVDLTQKEEGIRSLYQSMQESSVITPFRVALEKTYAEKLVHFLIQKHIKEYGKDLPLYIGSYNFVTETQHNLRYNNAGFQATSALYATDMDNKTMGIIPGVMFKLFKKIKGVSLEYVPELPGLNKKIHGYRLNLDNYKYENEIPLFSLVNIYGELDSKLFTFKNGKYYASKSRYEDAVNSLKPIRSKYPNMNIILVRDYKGNRYVHIENRVNQKIEEAIEYPDIHITEGNQYEFMGDIYPTMSDAINARYKYYNNDTLFSLDEEPSLVNDDDTDYDNETPEEFMNRINAQGEYSKSVSKIISRLKNRAKVFEVKNEKTLAIRDKKLKSAMIDGVVHNKALDALIYFLENSLETIAETEFELSSADMSKIDEMDLTDLTILAREVSKANIYGATVKEIAKDLISSYKYNKEAGANEIIELVDKLRSNIEDLEILIQKVGKPIVGKFLSGFNTNDKLNISEELGTLNRDLSFGMRHLDSMADADDQVLQLIDVAVKDKKEEMRMEVFNIMQDLLQLKKEMEKEGVKDLDYIYERLNGELTGNFVSQFNEEKFRLAKLEFFKTLGKRPKDSNERKQWNKEVKAWYKKHTQPIVGWEAKIKEKKRELSKEEYEMWFEDNVGTTEMGQYPKGELIQPSKIYLNDQYLSIITKDDIRKEAYLTIMELKEKLESFLPPGIQNGYRAPQVRKDFLERLLSNNTLNQMSEYFLDGIRLNEDEIDFGTVVQTIDPVTNEPFKYLPIYLTKRLGYWVDSEGKRTNVRDKDNVFVSTANTDLSTDAITSMIMYASMAYNYQGMSEIIDILELSKELVYTRDVIASKFGKEEVNPDGSPRIKTKGTDNAYKRLQDYFNMNIYGELKKKEGSIRLPFVGVDIDLAKLGDKFGLITSIVSLGVNIYAAVSNITLGNILTVIEAKAGQFYTKQSIAKALSTYSKNINGMVGDIGARLPNNKLSIWIRQMDVLQDFRKKTRDIQADRNKWYKKLFDTSILFWMTQGGEHQMQTTSSLALAYNTKVIVDGKESNLYDAYEVKNNRLVLKKNVTLPDGKPITDSFIRAHLRKQHKINQNLHGIYNDIDKSAFQQFTVGRLITMFRKFMKPGWNRRFQKRRWDQQLSAQTEGYYNTLYRLFKENEFKEVIKWYLIKASSGELTKDDIHNIKRFQGELMAIGTTMILLWLFQAMDDDDEKQAWYYYMLLYQMYRLKSELMFYWNPKEFFRILKSPAAAVDQLEGMLDIMNVVFPWNWYQLTDEYERGFFKGYTPLQKTLIQRMPITSTLNRAMRPEDMLQFFTAN